MQISLALAALRCRPGAPELAEGVLRGQLDSAVRIALGRLSRHGAGVDAQNRSMQGQLLTKALLALGREQEAEEIGQELRKTYDEASRSWVRWCTSLDQGWLFLSQHRPGRAIECFRAISEDPAAPPPMVLEANSCIADSLLVLGEADRALSTLSRSQEVCDREGLTDLRRIVDCHRLELAAQRLARRMDELSDHALAGGFRVNGEDLDTGELRQQLAHCESSVSDMPLLAHRLQQLQLLLTPSRDGARVAHFAEGIAWLSERRLAGLEASARIEGAMALIAAGALRGAEELLGAALQVDGQSRHARFAMDLQYCRSKVLLWQGHALDAIRAYKLHVEKAVYVIKRDFGQVHSVRVASHPSTLSAEDAGRLRLPIKYRAAYQYIIEHLAEPSLSVGAVAAHVGVTDRSLQLAFRTHLGMSPAEFIRKRRMERIRDELEVSNALHTKVTVLDVATRWGVSNRSTLAHNYRRVYDESPLETLRGAARPGATR